MRVHLAGRSVRAIVVEELDDDARALLDPQSLRPIEAVLSLGPDAGLIDLARYGTWRFYGWMRPFLKAALADRAVLRLSSSSNERPVAVPSGDDHELGSLIAKGLETRAAVLRVAPLVSRQAVIEQVLAQLEGTVVVLVPERHDAQLLRDRLLRSGIEAICWPDDWARAAAGVRVVVGTRHAVFARVASLSAIVVIDAHAESYREQRAPYWRAEVMALERARRTGAACLLVSATPSLELAAQAPLITSESAYERAHWPSIEVLDRRGDDPRTGLYAESLAAIIRGARLAEPRRPVVCVLNRVGRARLLSCVACGEIVSCEHCSGPLSQALESDLEHALVCARCGATRSEFCTHCGSTRLKTLRIGVSRAREELEALVGEAVGEIASTGEAHSDAGIVVGTEAALHRLGLASLVVFLDFDQHLFAPRARAPEESLSILGRASRLLGGRAPAGGYARRIVVQTRAPDHDVLAAALAGDPGLLADPEAKRRESLRLPPFTTFARLGGEGAQDFADRLAEALGEADLGAAEEGDYLLVRTTRVEALCDALASLGEAPFGLRVEVEPLIW